MGLSLKTALTSVAVGWATVATAFTKPSPDVNSTNYQAKDIITRDVCIIGGGSSGTYSAIHLRDMGKSVVVVERNDRLGGHTQTFVDPITKGTIDIGVIVFHDLDIVKDYFNRFNVPLQKAGTLGAVSASQRVDFRTGKIVTSSAPSGNITEALAAYGAHLAKYPYLEAGFNLPNPVPADLLLPFGEFVTKYKLDAMVSVVFGFGQGLGDLLHQPTIYVMKNFGTDILRNIQTGFLTTVRGDNSELYRKARTELGEDVLLNSQVLITDRTAKDGYVKIAVKTPSGIKLIRAKKIILTIPPKLENLLGFDLDKTERSLFGKFGNSAYYTGVLRNSGIPDNTSITNFAAETPFNLPPLPGVYGISPTGVKGLMNVKYGSPNALSQVVVKADTLAGLRRMRAAGTILSPDDTKSAPEFATFASHTPFELTVPPSAIAAGFYKQLYGLQGHSNTYYTGAAFHTHDSSLLWQFTAALLPAIAA